MLSNYLLINFFPFVLLILTLIELRLINYHKRDYKDFQIPIVLTLCAILGSCLIYLSIHNLLEGKWLDLFYYTYALMYFLTPAIFIFLGRYIFQKCLGYKKFFSYQKLIRVLFYVPYGLYLIILMYAINRNGIVDKELALEQGFYFDLKQRLILLYFLALILVFLLFYAKQMIKLRRTEYYTYLIALTFLIIGGFVDGLHYGIKLEWGILTLHIWVIFIFNYQMHISSDLTTGVFNKQSFDLMLSKLFFDYSEKQKERVYLFMIDMDKFPHINEKYGNLRSDETFIIVVNEINSVISPYNACFARTGGDDFCIIIQDINRNEAILLKSEIQNKIRKIFLGAAFSYPLTVSIGLLGLHEIKDIDRFITGEDKKMYFNKNRMEG